MVNKNTFFEDFCFKLPIIQAPMAGGVTTPELVAAVSNAGALGSLGAAYLSPKELSESIRAIKSKTQQAFAVNLFSPQDCNIMAIDQKPTCDRLTEISTALNVNIKPVTPPFLPNFEEQIKIIIEENVPIFSCIFGIPEKKYLDDLRDNNCKLVGTATNLEEATLLVNAKFDAIVAQGVEAGGHRGTFTFPAQKDQQLKTLNLVTQLNTAINIPIIAAGGIATNNHVKQALAAGASACQIGTAFITTEESGANSLHKSALIQAQNDHTLLTTAFSGRPARGINNDFIQKMLLNKDLILPFPAHNALTKPMRVAAAQQNNTQFMSLWSGQNGHLCEKIAAEMLIAKLIGNL